jgi:toxin YoeB
VRLSFAAEAWEDYLHWQATDKAMLRRLNRLIAETLRDPFAGIGKPEQLRHTLAGAWSRRIDDEHRLVYIVEADQLIIVQARHHY